MSIFDWFRRARRPSEQASETARRTSTAAMASMAPSPADSVLLIAPPAVGHRLQAVLAKHERASQHVSSDDEALAYLERHVPRAIMLAVAASSGYGYGLCNVLRKNPRFREIPLVMVSEDVAAKAFEQHRKLKTAADQYVCGDLEHNLLSALNDAESRASTGIRS